jgi:hypothetical protein
VPLSANKVQKAPQLVYDDGIDASSSATGTISIRMETRRYITSIFKPVGGLVYIEIFQYGAFQAVEKRDSKICGIGRSSTVSLGRSSE